MLYTTGIIPVIHEKFDPYRGSSYWVVAHGSGSDKREWFFYPWTDDPPGWQTYKDAQKFARKLMGGMEC